jgi:hypothetical protein
MRRNLLPCQVWLANEPLERAGMNDRIERPSASAGRSAPGR